MFCGRCGRPRVEDDLFCPGCGTPYRDASPDPSAAPDEPTMATDEAASGEDDEPTVATGEPAASAPANDPAGDPPYGPELTLAAGLATFFVPFLALIAALVMRAGELRPRRRGFLKTWAIASGAWLCTGWLVFLLVVTSSGALGGGGCQGGPDPFGLPSYTSSDGNHWTAHIPCVNGGSTSRPARPGEVPGEQP